MSLLATREFGAQFYPSLKQYLSARLAEIGSIPEDRKSELSKVSEYIRDCNAKSSTAKLIFICTHNSRRSHLSQIWAQVAAEYFGISHVETFSGGTEATAFNPRAVAAMQRCGLKVVSADKHSANPRYEVRTSDSGKAQVCFSKTYDSPPNPTSGYVAIMTCSQADDACPLVMGCEMRIPIRYEDPKVADDTDQEAALYDERSRQICREMLFVMFSI